HDVWVTTFSDAYYPPLPNANITFDDTENSINNHRIGQQHVQRAIFAGCSRVQSHAVTERFAASVKAFVTEHVVVFFDNRNKAGVSKFVPVTFGGTKHLSVCFSRHFDHDYLPLNPSSLARCNAAALFASVTAPCV